MKAATAVSRSNICPNPACHYDRFLPVLSRPGVGLWALPLYNQPMGGDGHNTPQYDAFISYRRVDGSKVARWLRHELEHFRLPRALRERYGRKLSVYLDTVYERAASDFHLHNVRPALMASRWLIVIATPAAVRRDGHIGWMQQEVEEFLQGPYARNVIVVRGAGAFDGPLPADMSSRFPNIEIIDLRNVGPLWFLNPMRASRIAGEKIKVLAPLLGIAPGDMPLLHQEEERRQQARQGLIAGVSAAIIAAVAALSLYAIHSQWRAQKALESSQFVTGQTVLSVASNLERDGAYAGLRTQLLSQTCDLIDKLSGESGKKPNLREQVVCIDERAAEREAQREYAQADEGFSSAVTLAQAEAANSPSQTTGGAVMQARLEQIAYLGRRKQTAAAQAALRALIVSAQHFSDLDRTFPDFLENIANAHEDLADFAAARKSADEARELLLAADASQEQAARLSSDPQRQRLVLQRQIRNLDKAATLLMERKDLAGARRAAGRAIAIATPATTGDPEIEFYAALAHVALGQAALMEKRPGEARAAFRQALARLGQMRNVKDGDLKRRADKMRAALTPVTGTP